MIGRTYSLDQTGDAFRYLEKSHPQGKDVVAISQEERRPMDKTPAILAALWIVVMLLYLLGVSMLRIVRHPINLRP